ncbi:MAG: Tim44 domain-containing protein [Alphaproteobacteria bacterium]|nr:Tim44 domain-containing protein [Alphaproteobacteria bacterium]
MSDTFLDLIFFAMVAAFLVLRLRSVLGRRTGNEPRPPRDPFASRRPADNGTVVQLPERGKPALDAPEPSVPGAPATPRDPIEAGLAQIQLADPSFGRDDFVTGARRAFEMVVHAFATGDTGTLRGLLSDEVDGNFTHALQRRVKAGETLETTIIGIKSADVVDARMEGRNAIVTIKFVSEQVNVTRDAGGKVVEGDPNQVTTVTDIWTFARNTRERDPNWVLVETRSEN